MTALINSPSEALPSTPDLLPVVLPSTPDYLKAKKRVEEARTTIEQVNAAIEAARVQQETVFKRHDGIIETMMQKRGALLADIAMGQNKQKNWRRWT